MVFLAKKLSSSKTTLLLAPSIVGRGEGAEEEDPLVPDVKVQSGKVEGQKISDKWIE